MLTLLAQQSPSDLPGWLQFALGPLGLLVFLLVIVVYGGMRRWWVFGWQYDETRKDLEEVIKERNMYREQSFKATALAESGAKVAEHLSSKDDGR